MIIGFVLVGLGLLATAWMVWAIHTDAARTQISLVETAILKTAAEEPLPKLKASMAFDRLQNWATLFLGLAMTGLGIVVLLTE